MPVGHGLSIPQPRLQFSPAAAEEDPCFLPLSAGQARACPAVFGNATFRAVLMFFGSRCVNGRYACLKVFLAQFPCSASNRNIILFNPGINPFIIQDNIPPVWRSHVKRGGKFVSDIDLLFCGAQAFVSGMGYIVLQPPGLSKPSVAIQSHPAGIINALAGIFYKLPANAFLLASSIAAIRTPPYS